MVRSALKSILAAITLSVAPSSAIAQDGGGSSGYSGSVGHEMHGEIPGISSPYPDADADAQVEISGPGIPTNRLPMVPDALYSAPEHADVYPAEPGRPDIYGFDHCRAIPVHFPELVSDTRWIAYSQVYCGY